MQESQDQPQLQPTPPAALNTDLDKSSELPVHAPDDETTRPILPDDEITLPILPEQTEEKPEQAETKPEQLKTKEATGQPANVPGPTPRTSGPAPRTSGRIPYALRRPVRIQRRPNSSTPSFSFTMITLIATAFIATFLIGLGYLHYKNAESEAREHKISGITFNDTPAKDAVYPSKHNCRVTGVIPGYGRYTLVFKGSKGEISPGVPNKEGRLTDVHYNKKTGQLTATCITGENVSGFFSGTLTKERRHFVYRATFTSTKGVDIDCIMVSK